PAGDIEMPRSARVLPRALRCGMRIVVYRVGPATAAVALIFGIGSPAITPAAAATTTLSTCSEPDFDSAVATGDTVLFGLDCFLTLTNAVTIPAGLSVDIEANGHQVTLSGGNTTRHFIVSGGLLTIGDVVLQNGFASGPAGSNGSDGAAGTNQDTTTGLDGTDGTAGQDGEPGAVAQGGSILIMSGEVTLNHVSLLRNAVVGGAGGDGGSR